ncbi:MAG: hypothetical protein ACR2QO_02505 [Acidimicrobiales bacterium]
MSGRDLLTAIWRRRRIVVFCALVALAIAWMVGGPTGSTVGSTYSASLSLTSNETEQSSLPLYGFIAGETSQIADKVADDLGEGLFERPTAVELKDIVEVTTLPEINTLTVSVGGLESRELAIDILDRYGQEIEQLAANDFAADSATRLEALDLREERLRERIAILSDQLDRQAGVVATPGAPPSTVDPVTAAELEVALNALGDVLAEAEAIQSLNSEDAAPLQVVGAPDVVEQAVAGPTLGSTGRLLVAGLVGCVVGLGIAIALDRIDTRLYDRKSSEAAFGLPVLAEIPKLGWLQRRNHQLITRADPRALGSDAYRLLRSSIARAHRLGSETEPSDRGTVVMVTSASPGSGKSVTAANLAVAAVDAGKSALVVSANLRQPAVHRFLGVNPGRGLTDAVDELEAGGTADVELDAFVVGTEVEGVSLLPSGHPVPNPGERLAAARSLFELASRRYDFVVIDASAMAAGNDFDELLPFVDLVVLVAKMGFTTTEEALWARETADRLDAPLCGVVLVGATLDHGRRWPRLSSLGRLRSTRRAAAPVAAQPQTAPAARTAVAAPAQPDAVSGKPTPTANGDASAGPAVNGGATTGEAAVAPAVPTGPVTGPVTNGRSVADEASTAQGDSTVVLRLNKPTPVSGSSDKPAAELPPGIADIRFVSGDKAASPSSDSTQAVPADGAQEGPHAGVEGADGLDVLLDGFVLHDEEDFEA